MTPDEQLVTQLVKRALTTERELKAANAQIAELQALIRKYEKVAIDTPKICLTLLGIAPRGYHEATLYFSPRYDAMKEDYRVSKDTVECVVPADDAHLYYPGMTYTFILGGIAVS